MAVSKKPRKKYRPRAKLADPVAWVLEGFRRLTRDEVLSTQTANHAALAALTQGAGTLEDWKVVTGALNMATVLDEQVYDAEYHEAMQEALQAHGRCGVRLHQCGRFGYSGLDLAAVNLAMEVHDVQLENTTVGEIEKALAEADRRHRTPKEHFTVRQMLEKETA